MRLLVLAAALALVAIAVVVQYRSNERRIERDACARIGGILLQPTRPGEPLLCQLQSAGSPKP